MITTMICISIISISIVKLVRYLRTRHRIERLMTLGPEWSFPRMLDREMISDDQRQVDALRARWRSMGPIR